MLMNKITKTSLNLLMTVFIFSITACGITSKDTSKITQVKYQYLHECTLKGKAVTHFITAKVPLTTDELEKLKSTLEENFQLDYNSCVFVGDLSVINKNRV